MNNEIRDIQSQLLNVSISINKVINGISTYYENELKKKQDLAIKRNDGSLDKDIESRKKLLIESQKVQIALSNSLQSIEQSQNELKALEELHGLTVGTDTKKVQSAVLKAIGTVEKRKLAITESVLKKLKSRELKYTKTTYETKSGGLRSKNVGEPLKADVYWDNTDSLSNEVKKQDNLMHLENSAIRREQMSTIEAEEYDKKEKLAQLDKLAKYEQEDLTIIRANRELSEKERKIQIKKKQTEIKKVTKSIAILKIAYDKYYRSEKRQHRICGALDFIRENSNESLSKIGSILDKELSKVSKEQGKAQIEIDTIEKGLNADSYIADFERAKEKEMLRIHEQQAGFENKSEDEKKVERLKLEGEEQTRRSNEASDVKREAQAYLRSLAEESAKGRDPLYQDGGDLDINTTYTHEQILNMEMDRINREAEKNFAKQRQQQETNQKMSRMQSSVDAPVEIVRVTPEAIEKGYHR